MAEELKCQNCGNQLFHLRQKRAVMVEITSFLLYNNSMKKTYESVAEWQALLAKKEDEIASLNRQMEWLTQQLRLVQG